jgi:hypothetical protein
MSLKPCPSRYSAVDKATNEALQKSSFCIVHRISRFTGDFGLHNSRSKAHAFAAICATGRATEPIGKSAEFAAGGGCALPYIWPTAQPDYRERRHEFQLGVDDCQRSAAKNCHIVM